MMGIPENFKDIIKKKAFGHLATVMSDGSPQVTPVWVDLEGEQMVFGLVLIRTYQSRCLSWPRALRWRGRGLK